MRPIAIIGAGYGDEGKGRWTDEVAVRAASRGAQVWVARFNSGAQAGHTVELPDGRRHVFHHVGSGSLAGAATYLGPEVAIHPMLLLPELAQLASWGVHPRLAISPQALLTLPYDVMINQALERSRGSARHGSCGVGFGEAVERQGHAVFGLVAKDLEHPDFLRARMAHIRQKYVPWRLRALGLPEDVLAPWLDHEGILIRYLADCAAVLDHVTLEAPVFLSRMDQVIFEGAQGLLLDMDLGHFPYVTRSHTGLPQVVRLARAAGFDALDVTYVTRAYATRHGAGPLSGELDQPPTPQMQDETNSPNLHQGYLRFAHLDLPILTKVIQADLARSDGMQVRHGLAVSCLDQMGPNTKVTGKGKVPTSHLAHQLAFAVGGHWCWEGWGSSRGKVVMPDFLV